MEHYLSSKKISAFKQKLIDNREQFREMIAARSEDVKERMSETGDIVDLAADHEKYLSAKREIKRLQESIAQIEQVLKDMDDFGYCIECGIEIGEDRLNIDPSYQLCIDCAEVIEKKRRLYNK